jgi:hypothetical protein
MKYSRFAHDLVILIEAYRRHSWLLPAVEKSLCKELVCPVAPILGKLELARSHLAMLTRLMPPCPRSGGNSGRGNSHDASVPLGVLAGLSITTTGVPTTKCASGTADILHDFNI